MRIRWSNRIAIVDGLVETGNIKGAREMAKEILTDIEAPIMLSDREITYLKTLLDLCGTEDDRGDIRNGEEAKDN